MKITSFLPPMQLPRVPVDQGGRGSFYYQRTLKVRAQVALTGSYWIKAGQLLSVTNRKLRRRANVATRLDSILMGGQSQHHGLDLLVYCRSFRKFALAVGATVPRGNNLSRKEMHMARNKGLKACIANLRDLQAKSYIEPEQKAAIEELIVRIRKLNRLQNPTRRELLQCVREVAKLLTKMFVKRR